MGEPDFPAFPRTSLSSEASGAAGAGLCHLHPLALGSRAALWQPRGCTPGSAHLGQVSVWKAAQVLLQGTNPNGVLISGGVEVRGQHGEEHPTSMASWAASRDIALVTGPGEGVAGCFVFAVQGQLPGTPRLPQPNAELTRKGPLSSLGLSLFTCGMGACSQGPRAWGLWTLNERLDRAAPQTRQRTTGNQS